MKYIVILCDGAADLPMAALDNKTPLEKAVTPNIDALVAHSEVGMVRTVPEHLSPGSDVANLSVMGYDPAIYYSGRSPLEAVSMGIDLEPDDLAFRCNLVTLSDGESYESKVMVDYSSDEISSKESHLVIDEVNRHFKCDDIIFHPGISYRHCMVWKKGTTNYKFTPPHDILERTIGEYLPDHPEVERILTMMKESNEFLPQLPVNQARVARGERPANSIWIWGQGRKPALSSFYDKYQLKGSVISAVDLIKGIGICAGMRSIEVEGATGNIHTNFRGKAEAALKELSDGQDYVYIHIEAPDECGHRFEVDNKVRSLELIDEQVVKVIVDGLSQYEDYKIMILPDHPTPLSLRTHTHAPVPFMIYTHSARNSQNWDGRYTEKDAANSSFFVDAGHKLMDYFVTGKR